MSNLDQVKEVRARSGVGIDACRKALEESGDDVEQALEYLRKKGMLKAADRAGRLASEGKVFSYKHADGKIVAVVEINCETDFAAKSDDFKQFADQVLMQITASSPLYLDQGGITPTPMERQREFFLSQIPADKPEAVKEKILEGKFKSWFSEVCLVDQESVMVPGKTIEQLRTELVARLGENVSIRRYIRWEMGEGLS
jgi:elongation factor Ts